MNPVADNSDTSSDTNAAIWKSDEMVAQWVTTQADRERHRAEQRRLLAALLPFRSDAVFTVVDLGAGTGAATQAVLESYPRASAVLAEYSAPMIEQGSQALAEHASRFRYVEFDLSSGPWPSAIPDSVDAVITSLCVHHLPDERKQQLFAEILERLAPGGWFFNYDPVRTDDPLVETVWQRTTDRLGLDDGPRHQHRTPQEQQRYDNHVRFISPLALQLDFLRSAGFEGVDVYWKQLDHVIYGGRRPE